MRLVEYDETASALIQDSDDDLVEDHLGKLAFDLLGVEADHLGDVVNLDAGEGFNDLNKILLKHGIVETTEVVTNKGIATELVAVRG